MNKKRLKFKQIPNGISDIAETLGLNPADTYWDFDWVHSEESGAQWPTDSLMGADESSIALLSRGAATGMTLKLSEGHLSYLREYAGVGEILEVTETLPVKFQYPDASVVAQLAEKIKKDERLRDVFNGKVFCCWLPASDTQQTVREIGGKTLISDEVRYWANSKVRVFSQAEKEGYVVAPFVIASDWDQLEIKMHALQEKARGLGVSLQTAKYWIKFDNLAGGEGVLPYMPEKMSFEEVKDWIRSVSKSAGFLKTSFHPIVMDIDLGSLPSVKRIVSNMCVQGIVSDAGTYITGTTLQRTHKGTYLGGAVPLSAEERAVASRAEELAFPVLAAAQRQGYRGYAGVDIIMTETRKGEPQGFILEMNGRLCSSTPLLSTAQWVAREAGTEHCAAMDFKEKFPPVQDFNVLRKKFNTLMYRGHKSGFEGLLPVWVALTEGKVSQVKMMAVAKNAARLEELVKEGKKVFKSLRSGKPRI